MMYISDKKVLVKYVSAFLLGDGWLQKQVDNNKNARYGLHQLAIHKDYIDWQASILENLTRVTYRYKDAYINSQEASIRIWTMAHPFYTTLYERIYTQNRVKSINPHDLKLLDWETLAILYQDDGYIEVSPRLTTGNYVRVRIATDNYTYGDLVLLQKAIFEKTKLPFDIRLRKLKNTNGYRLQLTKDYAKRFLEGIGPYVKDSYQYKLDIDTQTTKYHRMNDSSEQEDDEIVSTM